MSYKPGTILLVNFGEYAEEARKLDRELFSLSHIPLIGPNGFPYVAGYLSKPEKTKKDGYEIVHGDLEYVLAVADAFRKFPVNVKCEGEGGQCKNKATRLVVPYRIDRNREEKIRGGGPDFVNQTDISTSSFCCKYCGEERKYHKGGKVIELGISFSLPGYLTRFPEGKNWNFNREDFHTKLKRIAYQLKTSGIDDLIDLREIGNKRKRIDRYDAQRIVSRLLKYKEEDIPKANEEYESRELEFIPPGLHVPTWEEWVELRQPKPKRRSKHNPNQLDLSF